MVSLALVILFAITPRRRAHTVPTRAEYSTRRRQKHDTKNARRGAHCDGAQTTLENKLVRSVDSYLQMSNFSAFE